MDGKTDKALEGRWRDLNPQPLVEGIASDARAIYECLWEEISASET